jgi:hypothetical protein
VGDPFRAENGVGCPVRTDDLLEACPELRYNRSHLRHLFPICPQQPGYNKRLRRLGPTIGWLVGVLARDITLWTDDVWAKADERQTLLGIFDADPEPPAWRAGQVVIADKNYYGHQFEAELADAGLHLLRPARTGEAERPRLRPLTPLELVI